MTNNPKENGRKLLDALLEQKDANAIKLLKGKVDFSVECRGDNPIHLAARNGKLELIQHMKSAGCDLRQRNLHGNTATHYAARGGHIEVIEYLKKHGVDLNEQNDMGESPLDAAVTCQTMNIIETFVDLGMNPNNINKKTGETPLFTAVRAGAQEAMEGLLIKGANTGIRNREGNLAEDVGLNPSIKESLKMYTTLLYALGPRYIKAKGLKVFRKQLTKSMLIERVGVILEKFDIPKEFPTGFYCRREKVENATVVLKTVEGETVLSDVFHIRIFEVNRDCPAQINLPLYKAPTDKEEIVLRFVNSTLEDRCIETCVFENKIPYCPFGETLVPETNYICVVYVRRKKEENKVGEEATKITSEIEKEFALDIPPGSFEGETVLSLQVFGTHDDSTEAEKTVEDIEETQTAAKTDQPPDQQYSDQETGPTNPETAEQSEDKSVPKSGHENLLTDVYQINVSGQQPKKGLTVKIPLSKGMKADDDIAIVSANEDKLSEERSEGVLEVLPGKPKVVGCNIIFEVSHFSVFVATWKKKVDTKEHLDEVHAQISSATNKRKPASFFVVVKKDTEDTKGLRHVVVVECNMSRKSLARRQTWLSKEFTEQNPAQTGDIMLTPGDVFFVKLTGNATLEDAEDSEKREIRFLTSRSCNQFYRVNLNSGIYSEDDAYGHISVNKKSEKGLEEIARLRIRLTPPPRPPPTPSAATNYKTYINKRDYKKPEGSSIVKSIEKLFKNPKPKSELKK